MLGSANTICTVVDTAVLYCPQAGIFVIFSTLSPETAICYSNKRLGGPCGNVFMTILYCMLS